MNFLSNLLAGIGQQPDANPTSGVAPTIDPAAAAPPVAGANGGFLGGFGGGSATQGMANILKGIGSAAQAYTALQNIGLARDQLKFQKDAYRTNLSNQTQSYNTALEGRTRARFATEGRSASEADAYLAKHSL